MLEKKGLGNFLAFLHINLIQSVGFSNKLSSLVPLGAETLGIGQLLTTPFSVCMTSPGYSKNREYLTVKGTWKEIVSGDVIHTKKVWLEICRYLTSLRLAEL